MDVRAPPAAPSLAEGDAAAAAAADLRRSVDHLVPAARRLAEAAAGAAGAAGAVAATACDRAAVFATRFAYVITAALTAVVIWKLATTNAQNHVIAWGIAFIACAVSVPLSLYDVYRHIARMDSPLQVHYVRCCLMVPIFAVESWLSLVFHEQRHIFEALRAVYECFVISSFFSLMVDYFGGDREVSALLAARAAREWGHAEVRAVMMTPLGHPPLSWCVRGWRIDRAARGAFVINCRICIATYVVVQLATAVINLAAHYGGEAAHKDIFCEGESYAFAKCVYPWTMWSLLFWQCAAVFALVQFYHELKPELDHVEAMPKLFVVKLVVFVSFWQSLVIAYLTSIKVIVATDVYSTTEIGVAIQNFTICLEMAVAAVMHHRYFSQSEFTGARGAASGVLLYEKGALSPAQALRAFNPLPIAAESWLFLVAVARGRAGFDVAGESVFEHKGRAPGEAAHGGAAKAGGAAGGEGGAAAAAAPSSDAADGGAHGSEGVYRADVVPGAKDKPRAPKKGASV